MKELKEYRRSSSESQSQGTSSFRIGLREELTTESTELHRKEGWDGEFLNRTS